MKDKHNNVNNKLQHPAISQHPDTREAEDFHFSQLLESMFCALAEQMLRGGFTVQTAPLIN